MMGFREAYSLYRERRLHDCRKHQLAVANPEAYVDTLINAMTLAELLNELEMLAEWEDSRRDSDHEKALEEVCRD